MPPETTAPPDTTASPGPGAAEDPDPRETDPHGSPSDQSPEDPDSDETQEGGSAVEDPDAPPRPEIIEEEDPHATEALEASEASGITVTFDPNGGESWTLSTVVTVGEPYGILPGAEWRGRIFGGWWTQPEGGEQVFADTLVTRTEDHQLYAHWTQSDGFTIYFDANGGRIKSKESKLQLLPGHAVGTMPTPIREGYRFLGWFTDSSAGELVTAETVFESEEDRTVYAHWEYDAFAFWTFTLQNKTQQIYLCQQTPIYIETADHITLPRCSLIDDTGSYNIASYLTDPETTDDWVEAKNPTVLIRCVDNMNEADAVRAAMSQRFPGKTVWIVRTDALGSSAAGLYARLALAKGLYGDWYTDVDLAQAAAELGLTSLPIG